MLVRFVRSRFAAPLQFVLTLAVLIPASARPSFAEVKGVQPILLHCWSADSRNAMVNTISTHATRIAIGSAPYLPSNRGCNVAAGADRLANLKRAIQDLRHAGIEVDVIIHLANIHQTTVSSSLASQFLEVWTGLIVPYKDDGSVRFYISGSLEDQYTRSSYVTDGFVKMASALSNRPEDKKTLANLVATNRFFFHRSPNGNGGDGNLRFKTVLTDVNVPVTHERHGSAPDNSLTQQGGPSPSGLCRYCMWSNDGPFVSNETTAYKEKCVDTKGVENCGLTNPEPEMSMKTFRETEFKGNFRLLWRPAYNLFPAHDDNRRPNTRTFTKTANPRSDSSSSGFDQKEVDALIAFLP